MKCLMDQIRDISAENIQLKEENDLLKEKIVILTLANEELSSKVNVLEENMTISDIDTLYETIAAMNEEIEALKGGGTNV